MRTISVDSVVNNIRKYLENDSSFLEVDRDGKCTYYYTDNYNGHMSVERHVAYDEYRYKELKAQKVSIEEYKQLKREDLKYRYNEILKDKEKGLSVRDLLFLKLYESFRDYEEGKCELNDRMDIVEGIIGCDIDGKVDYVNDMNKLFKGSVNAMYDGFGYRDEGRPPISFSLFPDDIEDDYFEVDEYGFSDGYSKITSCEEMDYDAMTYAADDFLGSYIYDLSYPKFIVKINKHIPFDIALWTCDVFEKLESSDIYSFIDFDKYKKVNDLTDALLHDFFFEVRSKCLKALIENHENKDFMDKYKQLSLDDFRMNEDMSLEIINHQEFYKECGVEIGRDLESQLENEEREL